MHTIVIIIIPELVILKILVTCSWKISTLEDLIICLKTLLENLNNVMINFFLPT